MRTSVIRHRVADFLKQYPPFDSLSPDDLHEAAGSGRVKFHQANEYVFRQGQDKASIVWVVQQGRVDLIEDCTTGEQLRDILGEGDLIGLDRFPGNGLCLYSARTASDVILYGVTASLFESFAQRYPAVKTYLRAHFSVSSLSGSRKTSWLDAEAPPPSFLRARLVALPADASHAEVRSRLVGDGNPIVAFVEGSGRPLSIMTAAEFATAPTDAVSLAARPCRAALASPVATRAAVRALIATRSDALAVTADGTLDSALEGILTSEELSLFCGYNPVRLTNAIRNANSGAEITPLVSRTKQVILDALADPHDIDDCARMGTEVSAAFAESCLRYAHDRAIAAGISPPSGHWCWFQFGAAARGESIGGDFPSIAAVYEDSGTRCTEYFDAVSQAMRAWLSDCGLPSPATEWFLRCRPLAEWKRLYGETIRNPLGGNLYHRRELFDLAPLSGDATLLDVLRSEIRVQFRADRLATVLLANDTLSHLPPLTFFRGLVVDLDGAQRESVDIGMTAFSPIADAARVFAVASGLFEGASTLHRLQHAELDYPNDPAIFTDAIEAFRVAHYYRWLAGTPAIVPSRLGKFDQRLLKTAFSSIQRLLEFTTSTFIPGAE